MSLRMNIMNTKFNRSPELLWSQRQDMELKNICNIWIKISVNIRNVCNTNVRNHKQTVLWIFAHISVLCESKLNLRHLLWTALYLPIFRATSEERSVWLWWREISAGTGVCPPQCLAQSGSGESGEKLWLVRSSANYFQVAPLVLFLSLREGQGMETQWELEIRIENSGAGVYY